ncbi:DUF6785 family protein [Candidatus Sumerlaeota bacterium]
MAEAEKPESSNGWVRMVFTILLSSLGCLFVWVVAPYSNFLLRNNFISDDYIPVGAVTVILALALVVNPLLLRWRPKWALNLAQLAVIFGVVLMASVTPGQGLLRNLPYSLTRTVMSVNSDKRLADAYEKAEIPPSLFPDELGLDKSTAISEPFVNELSVGQELPWLAWLPPLFSWSGFLVPFWVMMIALAVIVFPQWRDRERVPFPLLKIQQAFIADPEPGRLFTSTFRSKALLAAAGMVFVIHSLAVLNVYFPGKVPTIPTSWTLRPFTTEPPLSLLHWAVVNFRVAFVYIGIAYFMPNRVAFSIWSLQLIYGVYWMLGQAYMAPFYTGQVGDHSTGAYLGLTVGILWLGRAHWWNVGRCVLFGAKTPAERRDRWAGIAFILGCLGMLLWFLWVGVGPWWGLVMIAMCFIFGLVLTRLVAETGLPLIAPGTGMNAEPLLRLAPTKWHSAASAYFSGVIAVFINDGNRMCVSTMAVHALGLNRKAGPGRHSRLAVGMLVVLVASLVICGGVHLYISYHNEATLNGAERPISSWGGGIFQSHGQKMLLDHSDGNLTNRNYHRPWHIAFGAGLAMTLQWLCMNFPRWPFHPISLVFVLTFYSYIVWFNVFVGWLAKVLIVRYGGAGLYRRAQPFFIGLIVGELAASAFWVLVSFVVAGLGFEYKPVGIQVF